MERIQESRLKILERWHSPYKRRSEVTFGSMESPVQHVGRHQRFAYQSHRKRTSKLETKLTPPSRHLTSVFISESTLFPPVNRPTVQSREMWLYTLENGKN
jgi:hypothetical protein